MIYQGDSLISILKKWPDLKISSWETIQEGANSQNIIMGSDATEFVNRANDEVRKRQKKMSNVEGEGEEHSTIW